MPIVTQVTAPTEEPVSLFEAVAHCRVDIEDDDPLIANLIKAARETVERRTGLCLVDRTLDIHLDADRVSYSGPLGYRGVWTSYVPPNPLPLPRAPLGSVTSVTYTDTSGSSVTVDSSNYRVITGTPGRIELTSGGSWGSGVDYVVRGVFGHGTAEDVPQLAKQAILLLVGHWYEAREAVIVGSKPYEVPFTAESLINLLKWRMYA